MSSGESDNSASEDEVEIIQEPETVEFVETSNTEPIENQGDEEGAPAEDADKKEVKVKRVRNPQPKLNADRLRGPRGLTVLEDIFKKVKFKGPKHEEHDLNLLMRTYEYWCHRLFPKFPFDDCLERLEKLGTTKPVQTFIKRIRMDLVLEDTPIIDSDDDDDVDNHTNAVTTSHSTDTTERDEFDRLLPSLPSQANEADSGELTEEQLARIRLNREKAQQRRKGVLNRNSQFSQDTNDSSSYANGITASQSDEPINNFDNVTNLDFGEGSSNLNTRQIVTEELLDQQRGTLTSSEVREASNKSIHSPINLEIDVDGCISKDFQSVGGINRSRCFLSELDRENSQSDMSFISQNDIDVVHNDMSSQASQIHSTYENDCQNSMEFASLPSEYFQNKNMGFSRGSEGVTETNMTERNEFENNFFGQSQLDTNLSSSSIPASNSQNSNQDCTTQGSTYCGVDQEASFINHIDTDKTPAACDFVPTVESEIPPTSMNFKSVKCSELRSSEEMIISEVDSPMDLDNV